jgi:hypothetical protein
MTDAGKEKTNNQATGNGESAVKDLYAAYLYYFQFREGEDRPYAVREYEYFNTKHKMDLKQKLKELCVNASADGDNPPRYSEEPGHMMMRRKSYVIFAVEGKGKSFPNKDAVLFTSLNEGDAKKTFEGEIVFQHVGVANMSVAVYENTMKCSSSGNELDDMKHENFSFHLNLNGRDKPLRPRGDSGGTNMGGPVPPPGGRKNKESPAIGNPGLGSEELTD